MWVKKNKAQDKWIKGSIIFANEEWTIASRILPQKDLVSECTIMSFPSKSPFSSHFFVQYQQHSHFLNLLTGIGSTAWTPGELKEKQTHKSLAIILTVENQELNLTSWMQKLGLSVPRPYDLYAQDALKERRKWRQPASWTSPFHVMYQTCKNSQMQEKQTLEYYLLYRMLRWKTVLDQYKHREPELKHRKRKKSLYPMRSCMKGFFCWVWLRHLEFPPCLFLMRLPSIYNSFTFWGGWEEGNTFNQLFLLK